jgi:glycosyltransferase involved in cell wall biosynthesis
MAKRNRRRFLCQALRCFPRQTYPNRELILVEDSRDRTSGYAANRPGVRYLRLKQPTGSGTKAEPGHRSGARRHFPEAG